MIRFTLNHLDIGSDSLETTMPGFLERITARLQESSDAYHVEVSASDTIALTLIDISQTLTRIQQRLDIAFADNDCRASTS